jgi:hypothetical protein
VVNEHTQPGRIEVGTWLNTFSKKAGIQKYEKTLLRKFLSRVIN